MLASGNAFSRLSGAFKRHPGVSRRGVRGGGGRQVIFLVCGFRVFHNPVLTCESCVIHNAKKVDNFVDSLWITC